MAFALVAVAFSEAPGGLGGLYQLVPAGGGGGHGGGHGGGQGGGGRRTSEGLNLDPKTLEQVKQILLREYQSGGSGGGGGPSSQYG